MKNLLNIGQALDRNEMKMVMAGGGEYESGGECDYNPCYRVEDFPLVMNCIGCVRVDQSDCSASCSSCCIV